MFGRSLISHYDHRARASDDAGRNIPIQQRGRVEHEHRFRPLTDFSAWLGFAESVTGYHFKIKTRQTTYRPYTPRVGLVDDEIYLHIAGSRMTVEFNTASGSNVRADGK